MAFALLLIPRNGPSRAVGPFASEDLAGQWAHSNVPDGAQRLIVPLDDPHEVLSYGEHALTPSPVPRNHPFDGGPVDSRPIGQRLRDAERADADMPAGWRDAALQGWLEGQARRGHPMGEWVQGDADRLRESDT